MINRQMEPYNFGNSPATKFLNISKFTGVDFANNPTAVANNRSPNAINILSDLAGKPVKRPGYVTKGQFNARINGIYRLIVMDDERIIVHAGSNLYEWDIATDEKTLIYDDMNDNRSMAFQTNKKLWILDGKTYLCYGDFSEDEEEAEWTVKRVSDIAYVPMVSVGTYPDGSNGTTKEDINTLTRLRTYSFYGTKDTAAKDYHLSVSDNTKLNDDEVKARILQDDGTWADKVENTDFTVNREKGIITFNTAPGESPSTIDNVEITVSVAIGEDEEDTRDIVNKCTIFTFYNNILFVSGNPEAPNFHYWTGTSEENKQMEPGYFPGFNYQYVGNDSTGIMGYSNISGYLAIHKNSNGQDENIFMLAAVEDSEGKTSFPIQGSIAGIGAVSKYAFARLDTEPLFLSASGVCAVTTQDYTARRYAQDRSYYVNPKLIEEPNLEEAVATEFNNRYWLAVNGHVYVADGRQKGYNSNAPMSEFQYEWYFLDNIPARVWWNYDGHLWFGDSEGRVRMFRNASENSAANPVYNDDGEIIEAVWDTPIFNFGTISQYKTLNGLWVMTAPNLRSGIEVFYRHNGMSTSVKSANLDIFSWDDIDFNRFTFYTDDTPRIVATNAKLKKFVSAQFRFRNAVLNDAFGFYEAEMQYLIGGRYKG